MFNFLKKANQFYKPQMQLPEEKPKIKINNDLDKNINMLKKLFNNSSDLTIKNMNLKATDGRVGLAVVTMEGLVDKETLATSVTNPLSNYSEILFSDCDIFSVIEKDIITCPDHITVTTLDEVSTYIMSGFACLIIDGCNRALAIGVQGYSFRSVAEPDTEVLQRGSREGFVEPIRINISMLRRRLRNTNLKFETMTVGTVSQTDICLCYLTDCVSEEILDEVRERLESVKFETLFASGYLVSCLDSDGENSLFSGVGVTERPDTACAKMCEGRIVITLNS